MSVARFLAVISLLMVLACVEAQETPNADTSKSPRVDKFGDPLPDGAIARFATGSQRGTSFFRSSTIRDVVYSPDGKEVWTFDRWSINRWDAASLELKSTFHSKSYMSLMTPTGNHVIVSTSQRKQGPIDIKIREVKYGVLDTKTRELICEFDNDERILFLAASPNGQFVIAHGRDHEAELWDVATGRILTSVKERTAMFRPVFASDSQSFFVCVKQSPFPIRSCLKRIDCKSGDCIQKFPAPDLSATQAAAISFDGRRLFEACSRTLRVVELATGDVALTTNSSKTDIGSLVFSAAISPDGTFLVVRSLAGNSKAPAAVFDARRLTFLTKFDSEGSFLECAMAVSPDSSKLVTGYADATVWDLARLRNAPLAQSESELAMDWADLASNAGTAYAAIAKLIDLSNTTVSFAQKTLTKSPKIETEKVVALMKALDDPTFLVRQKAESELCDFGPSVIPHLQDFIKNNTSAEARKRAEKIIAASQREALRLDRALEVLEAIGTPAARALLEELGKGDPAAKFTQDAQAGVRRIDLRR